MTDRLGYLDCMEGWSGPKARSADGEGMHSLLQTDGMHSDGVDRNGKRGDRIAAMVVSLIFLAARGPDH